MNQIANSLLTCKAVYIEPNEDKFFTWTSGKRSPIYCDNRQLISYPEHRKMIVNQFVEYIKTHYADVEVIAGTATAGIPWAAWIAEKLNLNMVYIRSKPKAHGMKSAIEGHVMPHLKTLIIEDLISTGKSSIEAVQNAKNDKLEVMAVLSIFNYGFPEVKSKFKAAQTPYHSLCTLDDLAIEANAQQMISKPEMDMVMKWKEG